MARICEVCGTTEEHDDTEPGRPVIHVCESCINDRAAYQHHAVIMENTSMED